MPKKLLVYVNIPFCNSKCHFCDWVQEIPVSQLRLQSTSSVRQSYIKSLADQIRKKGTELKLLGYAPTILYWGGGTATILTISEIEIIANALHETFDLDNCIEKTIEGSPETLTPEKLNTFYKFGFRRISIGMQSMNEKVIRFIGRSHSKQEGIDSVYMARDAGFDEINMDIISGFPNESCEEFESSLHEAINLPVSHFSVYPYRPTPGTAMNQALRNGRYSNLDLDNQIQSYNSAQKILNQSGFPEYAVSHFGKQKCLSDLAYFQLQMDWIGFGSGATSLINGEFLMTSRGKLEYYINNNMNYDSVFPSSSNKITSRLIYQSLSTFEGAIASNWEERTGMKLSEIIMQPEIQGLINELKKHSTIIQDNESVRFEADKLAESFIHLLFKSIPKEARENKLNNAVGTY